MKLRTIITTLIISSLTVSGLAQTTKKTSSFREKRNEFHSNQLAKHGSNLDQSTINSILEKNVLIKEASNATGTFSAASRTLSNDIIAEAFRHLGKPYVWGAKGPSQFDCSGFTSYVYRQFGYSISPGSKTQYTEGRSIARKDIRKGDLVFFTSPRSGSSVGHVGICVDTDPSTGTFTFVHASIKGVRVSSITEGYYSSRFIGARRVIAD